MLDHFWFRKYFEVPDKLTGLQSFQNLSGARRSTSKIILVVFGRPLFLIMQAFVELLGIAAGFH